jgi:hypothetical protein
VNHQTCTGWDYGCNKDDWARFICFKDWVRVERTRGWIYIRRENCDSPIYQRSVSGDDVAEGIEDTDAVADGSVSGLEKRADGWVGPYYIEWYKAADSTYVSV